MRSTLTLAAATAVVLLALPSAHAADLPPLAPPQFQAPVEDFSGWYLRGNVGVTNQHVNSLDLVPNPFPGTAVSTPFLSFDASPFFGLGVGYQLNNWFRFDVTGEYRSSSHFHGSQIASSGGVTLPDDYNASKSEWLFLTNAYVDLGTWWCVTPFVGAGIGASRNTISNFTDFGATMSGTGGIPIISTTYFADASKWNFAWALYAGMSYQVTPAFTVEFAYRYLNLGSATTGTPHAFDGTVIPTSPFVFTGLTSNDFMLGLRWKIGEPEMPMPLMRKG
jgi:opacity protein-like surface antigen